MCMKFQSTSTLNLEALGFNWGLVLYDEASYDKAYESHCTYS